MKLEEGYIRSQIKCLEFTKIKKSYDILVFDGYFPMSITIPMKESHQLTYESNVEVIFRLHLSPKKNA